MSSRVSAEPIVIHEDMRTNHILGTFLSLMVVGGLAALNAFVEMTGENRIAGNLAGVLLLAGIVGGWIYIARHPRKLDIFRDRIVETPRRRKGGGTIERTTGELTFAVRARGEYMGLYLTTPSAQDDGIAVFDFDQRQVRVACEALGWTFVEPTP